MSDESKRGRGRPRPSFTLERDEEVCRFLHHNGPTGRSVLADHFRVNANLIYLSLGRLRKAGRVQKVRDHKIHLWQCTASAF